jgi:hypothetical protein
MQASFILPANAAAASTVWKWRAARRSRPSAQTILSEIFVEENNNEVKIDEMRGGNSFLVILKMLFAKEQWLYSEVEELCKKHDMMIGSVLELINDYAYEKIGDSVIEDDGEFIYVSTEYKNKLI